MLFQPPRTDALIEGRLLRRYKRFLADIALPDGAVVVAHCANPGSMRTCAPDGARVWLSRAAATRKLAYTWELVEAEGSLVCVNTARANHIVAEALTRGVVTELTGYDSVRREVRLGDESRIDFLLENPGGRGRGRGRARRSCWVEVKSVTLAAGRGIAAFPDSVTERGARHLEELIRVVRRGERGVLLFCCNRSGTRRVRPADEIDPHYGQTLRRAAAAGVELLAYACEVSPAGVWLRRRIPVEL